MTLIRRGHFGGKVVLITGASSGIGEALAYEFGRQGADLALLARRKDRLERTVAELSREQVNAIALECDVNREGDLERAFAETFEKFGRIDVVVANAGFGVAGRLANLALEDFRRQFETNIFGVLRTALVGVPFLKKTRGSLVLMGSVAGYVALPGSAPYSMSKFAVRGMAEALKHELRPEGVSVTLISPGFVESDIRRVDNFGGLHPEVKDPIPAWLRMPAHAAARKMVRAIARRRGEEVITAHGKVAVWIQRHFPYLMEFAKTGGLRARSEPKSHS